MKVSAQYAEAHLTDILNAADSGAAVEIARPDQPIYRLTLVKSEPIKPADPRILGAGIGEMQVPSREEWKTMDKEMEHECSMLRRIAHSSLWVADACA
jgi:antitoxin (DNA-binding transcriptional repressor) of toxin-antitoxin stability system